MKAGVRYIYVSKRLRAFGQGPMVVIEGANRVEVSQDPVFSFAVVLGNCLTVKTLFDSNAKDFGCFLELISMVIQGSHHADKQNICDSAYIHWYILRSQTFQTYKNGK
jgi:hypothetical protein